jgi:hypothetical protein
MIGVPTCAVGMACFGGISARRSIRALTSSISSDLGVRPFARMSNQASAQQSSVEPCRIRTCAATVRSVGRADANAYDPSLL